MSGRPTPAAEDCCRWDGDDLVVQVAGKPGARQDRVGPVRAGRLSVAVRVPAEDGRATEAILRLLAAEFGVAPSQVRLLKGRHHPFKTFRVHAPGSGAHRPGIALPARP